MAGLHPLLPRPTDGSALLRVRAALPLLGPSERRVAQVILERPGAVTEWSTAELATEAGTSTATVVRACQNLGFRGFQHLRLEVARAAPTDAEPAEDAHPLARIFADAGVAISLGMASVDAAGIDAAVEVLAGARRLVLVGTGFSGPPLQDAAMRFATLGRAAEAPLPASLPKPSSSPATSCSAATPRSTTGSTPHCSNSVSGWPPLCSRCSATTTTRSPPAA
ncbi:MurR/RpiR family transcriptional regulator [Cryobacterium sp.]|uniref:MurR/RpiR family transcriptional regulator n=1 Tax=Cryobacterium sp. TaxID=1926290 RepID=UPI00260FE302|nr:MurR/RpiR family transcriptional regulator [Cryobacterium sp.]MCU1445186.1 transcriptional regulator [Cryobacterium sp.]